jgi:hypothetical protein
VFVSYIYSLFFQTIILRNGENASRTEYSGIVAVDSKWKGMGRRVSFLEIKESLGQIIRNEDLGKRRKVAVREEMFVFA